MILQLYNQIPAVGRTVNARVNPDPRVSILITIMMITGIVSAGYGNWLQFGAIGVWLIVNILISGQTLRSFSARILKIYPMILLMSIMFLFTKPDIQFDAEPVISFGIITIFRDGIIAFLDLNLRSILIVSSSFLLIFSVPFEKILQAIAKSHLPDWIEAVLIYMHRFIFLIGDEFSRIYMAYNSRAINLTGFRKIRIILSITGVYLTRLIERSERSHLSMVSKGFTGKIHSLKSIDWRFSDSVILVGNTFIILLIVILL